MTIYDEFYDFDDNTEGEDCAAWSPDGERWVCPTLGSEDCEFWCAYFHVLQPLGVTVESIKADFFVLDGLSYWLMLDEFSTGSAYAYLMTASYDVPLPPDGHVAWQRMDTGIPF